MQSKIYGPLRAEQKRKPMKIRKATESETEGRVREVNAAFDLLIRSNLALTRAQWGMLGDLEVKIAELELLID